MMLPHARLIKIKEVLTDNTIVKLEKLQEYLPDVSLSTIRRDVKELVQQGVAIELKGGGIKIKEMGYDTPVRIKEKHFSKEKKIIANFACSLISENDTIYVDSGTTLSNIFSKIFFQNITIVTSNSDIYYFIPSEDIVARIIQLGGEFNSNLSSIGGPITNLQLEMLHYDKAFLGASGVDESAGITTPDFHEMAKKQIVLRNAKQSFFLLDSSKHSQVFVSQICKLEDATIICDKYISELDLCKKYFVASKYNIGENRHCACPSGNGELSNLE